jgi:hypothetical protein
MDAQLPAGPTVCAAGPGITLTADEKQDDVTFADGSEPGTWDVAGIDDPLAFKAFLKQFQAWVAAGDRQKVADCTQFPLRQVPDRAAFLAQYETLMSAKVKGALAGQSFRQIFRNDQGAMIGDGELWFGQAPDGKTFRLIAVNP